MIIGAISSTRGIGFRDVNGGFTGLGAQPDLCLGSDVRTYYFIPVE